MLRKHASLIIAICLVGLVTTACIVRTGAPQRHSSAQPAYVEKQKKPKKQKDNDHRGGKQKH